MVRAAAGACGRSGFSRAIIVERESCFCCLRGFPAGADVPACPALRLQRSGGDRQSSKRPDAVRMGAKGNMDGAPARQPHGPRPGRAGRRGGGHAADDGDSRQARGHSAGDSRGRRPAGLLQQGEPHRRVVPSQRSPARDRSRESGRHSPGRILPLSDFRHAEERRPDAGQELYSKRSRLSARPRGATGMCRSGRPWIGRRWRDWAKVAALLAPWRIPARRAKRRRPPGGRYRAIPMTAFTRIAPIPMGIMYFQPMFMSWS